LVFKLKMTRKIKYNSGFTYVELIVVLSIFAVMSAVAIFNYNKFQGKVDIKNLSNDIALQIFQAQKSAISGSEGALVFPTNDKPSYGVYFSATATPTQFLYFADLNNSGTCDTAGCNSPYAKSGEVQNIINITKGNTIVPATGLVAVGPGCTGSPGLSLSNLTVTFKRPSPTAMFSSTTSLAGCTISYVVISIVSKDGTNTAKITVYPSGRIQIN